MPFLAAYFFLLFALILLSAPRNENVVIIFISIPPCEQESITRINNKKFINDLKNKNKQQEWDR